MNSGFYSLLQKNTIFRSLNYPKTLLNYRFQYPSQSSFDTKYQKPLNCLSCSIRFQYIYIYSQMKVCDYIHGYYTDSSDQKEAVNERQAHYLFLSLYLKKHWAAPSLSKKASAETDWMRPLGPWGPLCILPSLQTQHQLVRVMGCVAECQGSFLHLERHHVSVHLFSRSVSLRCKPLHNSQRELYVKSPINLGWKCTNIWNPRGSQIDYQLDLRRCSQAKLVQPWIMSSMNPSKRRARKRDHPNKMHHQLSSPIQTSSLSQQNSEHCSTNQNHVDGWQL